MFSTKVELKEISYEVEKVGDLLVHPLTGNPCSKEILESGGIKNVSFCNDESSFACTKIFNSNNSGEKKKICFYFSTQDVSSFLVSVAQCLKINIADNIRNEKKYFLRSANQKVLTIETPNCLIEVIAF